MTDRELMQMALVVMQTATGWPRRDTQHERLNVVIEALRERLAQPEDWELAYRQCALDKQTVIDWCIELQDELAAIRARGAP